ncbi:MAG: tyrosine-type recombinase/integrase [Actinomycetota bacterium]
MLTWLHPLKLWSLQDSRRGSHEINRGIYIDRSRGKTPFEEVAADWIESKVDLRLSTWTRDESYLRNHVVSAFRLMAVAAITKADVQAWVRDLQAKGLAPATIRQCYRILNSVLEDAVDHKLIVEPPCRKIALPRSERQEHLYLEPGEVERLAAVIDPLFQALIYSAVYLGCRWGELVGLKRHKLNILRRQVTIIGSLEEVGGNQPRYVQETKTKSSRRMLTMPPFLCEILAQHLAHVPETEFVFVGRDGGLLRRNNFRRRHWKPAVLGAELPQGLRFHDLRHTCASILISQGAHPKEIQARLGHASIITTMDRYGHLFPSLGAQLDDNLEHVFRAVRRSA